MKTKIVILFYLLFLTVYIFGEEIKKNSISYEINTIKSSKNDTPFWIKANRNGRISDKDLAIGDINIKNEVNIYDVKLDFGTEIYYNVLQKDLDTISTEQLYLDVLYGPTVISLGSKKREDGINVSELSTGSLLVGNNASPIPQLRIGSIDYINVPFTFSKLYFKWFISNGWLENERTIRNPMLHEKELDVKFEVNNRLRLKWSMRHDAIWGGTNPDGTKNPQNKISDYSDVFFARYSSDESALEGEKINVVGDHKGLYQYRIEYDFEKYFTSIFAEHFFEDGSGRRQFELYGNMIKRGDFPSKIDGRFGLEIGFRKNSKIQEILFEYINTKYQSGSGDSESEGGRDSYYLNYMYGPWQYKGYTIGNPMFLIKADKNNVDYKNTHTRFDTKNIGIKGKISKDLDYKINLTFAKYYLTHVYVDASENDPMKKVFNDGIFQNYFLIEVKKSNLFGTPVYMLGKIGYDNGGIVKGNFGQEITFGAKILY